MDPEVNSIDATEAARLMYIVLGIYAVGLLIMAVGSVFVFLHHSNDRSKSFWTRRREKYTTLKEQRGSGLSAVAEATADLRKRDQYKQRRHEEIERRLHPHPFVMWLKRLLVRFKILRF